jgi:two-component system response regulator HydG
MTAPELFDKAFLAGVLDGIRDSIKIVDRQFNVVYANRAAALDAGRPVSALIHSGKACYEEFNKSREQCAWCVVNQVLLSGEAQFNLFRPGGKNGSTREISAFPLKNDLGAVEYVIEIVRDVSKLGEELAAREEFANIITQDPKMREVFDVMTSVAPTDATVLIYGETGAGKELVARAIHNTSKRAAKKFVAINCGALTESLLETELFGHEKGAFTGAEARRIGKFEAAHEGTLFLDELGTITPAMQVKILRALQEGEINRVGGNEPVRVDVRLVGSANVDLVEEVKEGRFREDLYYRVNVVPLRIPALRERVGDIELLADHYLKKFNEVIGKNLRGFSAEALEGMRRYPWPGNVRELRNLVERAVILSKGPFVERLDIPAPGEDRRPADTSLTLADVAAAAEKEYLIRVLESYRGNINKTAEHAGVNTRTIHRKMRDYDIRKEDFKR